MLGVMIGPLAFAIYVAITPHLDFGHLSLALHVTVALLSAAWIMNSGNLAWVVLFSREPDPAAKILRVTRQAALLLMITVALLGGIGQQFGWTHGPYGDTVAWVGVAALLGVGAYWIVGERHLKAILKARSAGTQASSS